MDGDNFWLVLGVALGLALIIEGLFPFVSPAVWRRTFEQIQKLGDGQVRFFGLCSIAAGSLLVLVLILG